MATRSKSKGRVKKKKVVKKIAASTAKKKKTRVKSAKKAVVTKKTRKGVVKKTAKKIAAKKKVPRTTRKKKTPIKRVKKLSGIQKPPVSEPSISVIRETIVSVTEIIPGDGIPAAPPSGLLIGKVTHYYNHSNVAIIELEAGTLQVGDTVHIKGHTTDFKQVVESMEIENQNIETAEAGQTIGLKVTEMVREHDKVYISVNNGPWLS